MLWFTWKKLFCKQFLPPWKVLTNCSCRSVYKNCEKTNHKYNPDIFTFALREQCSLRDQLRQRPAAFGSVALTSVKQLMSLIGPRICSRSIKTLWWTVAYKHVQTTAFRSWVKNPRCDSGGFSCCCQGLPSRCTTPQQGAWHGTLSVQSPLNIILQGRAKTSYTSLD